MKKFLSKFLIIASLAMCSNVSADYCFPAYVGAESDVFVVSPRNFLGNLTISPLYGKAEMKQGTVKSNGWLYGIRSNYDLIISNNVYVGAELGYKQGDLKGKTSIIDVNNMIIDPSKTKSKYSDLWGEFRLGYTIGSLGIGYVSPYFLVGYEKEKDNFVSPSPMPLKHSITYGYFGCGVVSNFAVSSQMNIGVNAKFKWMFNAKTKLGNDEYVYDNDVSCGNCFHWQIELPVTYLIANNISVGIAPFYEYKNYDKHKFEWIGTEKAKFHMWGGLLNLGFWF